MVSIDSARKLALKFPEAEELPHFEKASFRVKKKIFATLDSRNNRCVVKLSSIDQSLFCDFDKKVIYPVKGAWGKKGFTVIELKKVPVNIFKDALLTSYCQAAPEKLAKLVRPE
jgi:predicted DNA-binding protein (MmcQ/YjbR family)